MRIATWNVNSLKARLPRVIDWIGYASPDVLCLQETKLADDAFPALDLLALGYECVHFGEGRWNGVAICSRVGIDAVVSGFAPGAGDDPEARLVTARCGAMVVSSVYVPNGRELGHDQYLRKLAWLASLRSHLDHVADPTDDVVVCGDFNVAPDDRDVWDPAAVHGGTHVSPPERRALQELCEWGLTDLFRVQYERGELYSWWDYRAGAFHKRQGMRIDLVLGSASVVRDFSWALIDRSARKGPQPSDHAPVIVELRSDSAVAKAAG